VADSRSSLAGQQKKHPRELLSLTSLRFLAASLVVAQHASVTVSPSSSYGSFVTLGYVGVSFFFVLSGFVLTWSYRDRGSAGNFYGRRFARVWPLHFFTTCAVALVMTFTGEGQNFVALIASLLLIQAWIPSPDFFYAYNGPSWSLSCEAFFYLSFPLLIRWASSCRRPGRQIVTIAIAMGAVVALIVVFGPVVGPEWRLPSGAFDFVVYIFPPYRIGEFALGVLLGVLVRSGWRSPVGVMTALVVTALAFALVTFLANIIYGSPGGMPKGIPQAVMMVPFLLLVGAAASADVEGRSGWLHSRVLVRLGRASFALYLLHLPIFELVDRFFLPEGGATSRVVRFLVSSSSRSMLR